MSGVVRKCESCDRYVEEKDHVFDLELGIATCNLCVDGRSDEADELKAGEAKPDVDMIAEEIKATIEEEPKEDEQPEEPEGGAIVKRTADDLADRRAKAWALRQRGKTYREIGKELGISLGTVKRDLDISRAQSREAVTLYDREDHIATNLTQYDDLIREAWAVHTGADKETKLKALTLIKQTMQAKEKSLQANGVVRKEAQVQETVQISLVSRFDDSDVAMAAAALLGSQMSQQLTPPTPDIEEAEIVEDEE